MTVTGQFVIGVLGIGVALLAPQAAQAGGPFNLPTSFCQCMGYGVGPGYHAPMALGSPLRARSAAKPLVYLHRPLRPDFCAHGFCGDATSLAASGPAVWVSTPTYAEPVYPTPTPAAPAPVVSPPPFEPASPSDTPRPEPIPLPLPNA